MMGSNASATIAFGIDLGNSDNGWNFERDDYEGLPFIDSVDGVEWDDLIAEFGGFTEPEVQYGPTGTSQYESWSSQRDRFHEAKESTELNEDHYGYEFNGNVMYVGKNQMADWGYEPLEVDLLKGPSEDQVQKLRDFVLFLDSKGLKLKEEFREPKWLLMAHYG